MLLAKQRSAVQARQEALWDINIVRLHVVYPGLKAKWTISGMHYTTQSYFIIFMCELGVLLLLIGGKGN